MPRIKLTKDYHLHWHGGHDRVSIIVETPSGFVMSVELLEYTIKEYHWGVLQSELEDFNVPCCVYEETLKEVVRHVAEGSW